MKEEKKSKTTTKKTTAVKAVKKSTTKKVAAPNKVEPVKKTTTRKTAQVKKSTPATKKVETKVVAKKPTKKIVKAVENEKIKEPSVEVKENTLDKELILRTVLIMTFAIITGILIMGFIDYLTNTKLVNDSTNKSYLVKKEVISDNNVINLNDAKYELSRLNGDYFIYISNTDNNIELLERQLAGVIKDYDLEKKFYYINIDEIKNEDNVVDLVNKDLGYSDVLISKVPTIVYVNKDNIVRIENIITRDDAQLMTVGDFQRLLDTNGFLKKN